MAPRKDPAVNSPTLSLAPRPISWHVARQGGHTAITRVWRPGEAARCKLCPRGDCRADETGGLGVCLVMVDRSVSDQEARLYSTRDRVRLGLRRAEDSRLGDLDAATG